MPKKKRACVIGNAIYVENGQITAMLKGLCGDVVKTMQDGTITVLNINGQKVHLPTNMTELILCESEGGNKYER